jgi:hypothetical protein
MRRKTLALGAILSAWGGAAVAQQAPQVPQITATRDWQLDARVLTAYDSNLARGNSEIATARGVSQDDITVTPSVHANIVQPFGSQAVFLDGFAGYDFHAKNPKLDSQRFAISTGAAGVVGPCRPTVFGSYREQQSDLADLNLVSSTNRVRAESIGAAIGCGRAVGINGNVAVSRTNVTNSAAQLRVSDYTGETLSISVAYLAPTLVNAALIYSYANNEYPNRINLGRPVGDGFFTETLGLRLDRRFGSRITVAAGAAATRLKREFAPPGTPQKISATTYDASVSYQIGRRIQLDASGVRNVVPSSRPGKLYDIAETLQGSATYRLGSRISLSVGHTYSDMNSNVDTALVGLVVTSSVTNSTYGRVDLQRIGPGTVSLDVRHERRDANLPSFNYSATRVALTTSVSF